MQERKYLALTLRDTNTVIGRLALLIGAFVHATLLFGYLAIWKASTVATGH